MIRKLAAIPLLTILLITTSVTNAIAPTPILPVPDNLFHEISIPESKIIYEPDRRPLETKPPIVVPLSKPKVVSKVKASPKLVSVGSFIYDSNVSWYGPGFYGGKTACGQKYTKTIMGVAHRSLPCGTLVTFMWKGTVVTVPVIDRGPYVTGRHWDLSGALCTALHHCFTGPLYYRVDH